MYILQVTKILEQLKKNIKHPVADRVLASLSSDKELNAMLETHLKEYLGNEKLVMEVNGRLNAAEAALTVKRSRRKELNSEISTLQKELEVSEKLYQEKLEEYGFTEEDGEKMMFVDVDQTRLTGGANYANMPNSDDSQPSRSQIISDEYYKLHTTSFDMFSDMRDEFTNDNLVFNVIQRNETTAFLVLVVYLLIVLKKWRIGIEKCCKRRRRINDDDDE